MASPRRLTKILGLVVDLATTDERHLESGDQHDRCRANDGHQAHLRFALFLFNSQRQTLEATTRQPEHLVSHNHCELVYDAD